MTYWYPKKSRVEELVGQLAKLERALEFAPQVSNEQIGYLSAQLAHAQSRQDFPSIQVLRWLWLASQYRLHSVDDGLAAAKAAAALQFLDQKLRKARLEDADRQDLNWVLESTVRELASLIGPADLRGCLSEEELRMIDDRLAGYDDGDFDAEEVGASIEHQLEVLRQFGGLGDLTSLESKVATLLASARQSSPDNAPARAALRYLADKNDVIGDRHGVLGLIDDVYVIEWAYAAVESQTRCLPILDAMLRRWPFVGSTGLGAYGAPLDRFGQYVSCASLMTLFGPVSGALILRDIGPYPILAAVAAGIEAARLQSATFEEEIELWMVGDPVTVSDGTTTFHARYGGSVADTGRPRWRLLVAESGSITVGEEVLPYLARAPRDWKRLSNGRHILLWLKDRNVDSLMNLTGYGRRRPQRHEAVLLLVPRAKLDHYLGLIRPLGMPAAALLGARWTEATGHQVDLPGSATDRPLLYACADPAVAFDLVGDPPDHIASWRIIVDGAAAGRTLHASLSTSDRLDRASLCIFAELHDRESTSALLDQGLRDVWYLEDQDVVVPPVIHPGRSAETNSLARFLQRRSAHWAASRYTHGSSDAFLEAVSSCLLDHNRRRVDDPSLNALDLAVAAFLRKAIGQPLVDDADAVNMASLARSIVGHASMLAAYDAGAARIRELFGGFLAKQGRVGDRRGALMEIAAQTASDETVAVVCRSVAIAERCRAKSGDDTAMKGFEWTTIEGLRMAAPFDRVVVPGWLGRRNMREIANNGYSARTDMLLLPFEQRWYDGTMAAARSWERQLERRTSQVLKTVVDGGMIVASARWHEQAARRFETMTAETAEPTDDRSEIALIESHALDALQKSLSSGRDAATTTKAQLVLLEEPGSFVLLPPSGQVIVLSSPSDPATSHASGSAEHQLFVAVSNLRPGMLLALPESTDRDLIDARADGFLDDAVLTRSTANGWKHALRRHIDGTNESYASFSRRLAAAGEPRDPLTVRSWVNDTRSVAPRNYRVVVPLLAQLTGDQELSTRMRDVLGAIERVYRARNQAAEAILSDIFSGALDLSLSTLAFEVGGHRLTFALRRVDRCVDIRDVPIGLIGRPLSLVDLPTWAPA